MNVLRKYPIYRKFITNNFISTLGDSMYYVALMSFASQFSQSGIAISMVSLSEAIPSLLFIVMGSLADMSRNKTLKMLVNGGIRGIIYFLIGIMIGFQPSLQLLAGICILNFISDCIGKYSSGLMTPFVLFMVDREEIEEAQGLSGAVTNLVGLLAQFIGAYLIGLVSYEVLAWINSGTFFVSVGLLLSMKKMLEMIEMEHLMTSDNEKISVSRLFRQIVASLKAIKKNRSIFMVIVMFAIANGALSVLVPLISLLLSQNPQLVIQSFAFTFALTQGMISVGVIFGSLWGPKVLSAITLKNLCQGMFLANAGIAVAMFSQQIWLLLLLLLILGLLIGAASPKLNTLLISQFPVEKLGTISGGVNTLLLVTPPVATVIFTTSATVFSLKVAIIFLFIFSVVSFIFGYFQSAENRRGPLENQS